MKLPLLRQFAALLVVCLVGVVFPAKVQAQGRILTINLLGKPYDVYYIPTVLKVKALNNRQSFLSPLGTESVSTVAGVFFGGYPFGSAGIFSPTAGRSLVTTNFAVESIAEDISDTGWVIGWQKHSNTQTDRSRPERSFRWSAATGMQYLDDIFPEVRALANTLDGFGNPVGTTGLRINRNGEMIIYAPVIIDNLYPGFHKVTSNGVVTPLRVETTQGLDLNNHGELPPPGLPGTQNLVHNDNGEYAGVVFDAPPSSELSATINGRLIPNSRNIRPTSINNAGYIAAYPGIIWSPNGTRTDLRVELEAQDTMRALSNYNFYITPITTAGSDTFINDAGDINWASLFLRPACPEISLSALNITGIEFTNGQYSVRVGNRFKATARVGNVGRAPLRNVKVALAPASPLFRQVGTPAPPIPATLEPGQFVDSVFEWEVLRGGDYLGSFAVTGDSDCGPMETHLRQLPIQFIGPPLEINFSLPADQVGIGQKFDLQIDLRNNSTETLTAVEMLPPTLRTTGGAQARLLVAPLSAVNLPVRSGLIVTYSFEATRPGRMAFHASAQGRRPDGSLIVAPEADSDPVLISPGDLSVKRDDEGTASYAGREIYQSTALDPQIKTAHVPVDQEAKFQVRIHNRDSEEQEFILQATVRGKTTWERTYLLEETFGTAPNIETPGGATLEPFDGLSALTLDVTVNPAGGLPGESQRIEFTLRPALDPSIVLDVVEVVTEVVNEIIVNTTGDESDADFDDDVPDVDLSKPDLQVTLRSAIEFANRRAGKDIIKFHIPATDPGWLNGLPWIRPRRALPQITKSIDIDATTHPVSARVALDGLVAGVADGLRIIASNCVVRGMVITRFQGAGISIEGGHFGELTHNIIGTTPVAQAGLGNGVGIRLRRARETKIGGGRFESRNVISGNVTHGVDVADSENVKAQVNFVGTTLDGIGSLPNGFTGFLAERVTNVVIGLRDQFSIFNSPTAIKLSGVSARSAGSLSGSLAANALMNCRIGLNGAGNVPLGGTINGLVMEDSADVAIGGGTGGGGGSTADVEALRNIFSGITSNAMRFLRSTNIQVGVNHVGTDLTGNLSLRVGTGIRADRVDHLAIGHTAAPSCYEAEIPMQLSRVTSSSTGSGGGGGSGGNSRIVNCLIGLAANGAAAFGTAVHGVILEDCSDFEVGFGGSQSGGDSSEAVAARNFFSGIASNAMWFLRSTNIHVGANYVGTDVSGNASLAVGTGIVAEQIRNLTIGLSNALSVYNGRTGIVLRGMSDSGGGASGGGSDVGNRLINCYIGLKAQGTTAFNNMINGLIVEDSSSIGVGFSGSGGDSSQAVAARNVFSGILSNAMSFLRSTNIQVGANHIGTDAAGNASAAVGVGILAEQVRDLFIGASNSVSVLNARQVCAVLRNVTSTLADHASSLVNCHVGVRADGGGGFGSGGKGVEVHDCADVRVGKPDHAKSGNFFGGLSDGVEIRDSRHVRVQNAKFGLDTDKPAKPPIPNTGAGIVIAGNSHNIHIGGDRPHEGNTIAHCNREGVHLSATGTNLTVKGNVIFRTLKPIRRVLNGGHFPTLTKAFRGSTHVEGTLNGRPGDSVRLEFFGHRPDEPTEAEMFLGAVNVLVGASGSTPYNAVFPKTIPGGWKIASTASDSFAGTSEFSLSLPVSSALDSDGDGMPDFWEEMFLSCLNPLVRDGDGDCDGDGFTNLQEYLAGTDPTRADSALRVENLAATADGATLKFTGVAGRQYGLERRTDLSSGSWLRVATAIPEADGEVTLSDPDPPEENAYYRIVAEFPW